MFTPRCLIKGVTCKQVVQQLCKLLSTLPTLLACRACTKQPGQRQLRYLWPRAVTHYHQRSAVAHTSQRFDMAPYCISHCTHCTCSVLRVVLLYIYGKILYMLVLASISTSLYTRITSLPDLLIFSFCYIGSEGNSGRHCGTRRQEGAHVLLQSS